MRLVGTGVVLAACEGFHVAGFLALVSILAPSLLPALGLHLALALPLRLALALALALNLGRGLALALRLALHLVHAVGGKRDDGKHSRMEIRSCRQKKPSTQ